MAHWKKRFPSRYLQVSDLDGGSIDATIKTIGDELIGMGEQAVEKPVVYFKEKDVKPCVLNQTRADSVAQIAGTPDDDKWSGVRVRLQKGRTRFQGKAVECIDIVSPPTRPPKGKTATVPGPDDPDSDLDTEEPF